MGDLVTTIRATENARPNYVMMHPHRGAPRACDCLQPTNASEDSAILQDTRQFSEPIGCKMYIMDNFPFDFHGNLNFADQIARKTGRGEHGPQDLEKP